ncbi:MAG: hypothetical protein ONB44_01395 [candidate division KSB1 bacterium]|nr:hypothetical protein [candidate division KSB1 bacterium]MDZ7300774.1 hypothetical protein [candidate division KSB1 bacterium]MDZ7309955.1 hypothetical protein [candidate division KSB1 bacterium]
MVLIIESEIVPRLLYQAKFQAAGFETIAVGSGQEALAVVQRQKIDIVVMDLFAKTYRSLEIMEALVTTKPQLPILLDAAIYDFWKHAHENIREVYAALTPDLKVLLDETNRLIGKKAPIRMEAQQQYWED